MAEMWISMGPQHPMTHGLWTLKVKVDGETVVDTEPDLGYIHRGVEKICESRDFTQITTVTGSAMPVLTLGHMHTSTQPRTCSRLRSQRGLSISDSSPLRFSVSPAT